MQTAEPGVMSLKSTVRRLHNLISLVIIAPLFLTAVTGVLYQIGRLWLGLSKENMTLVLRIHQMSILGKTAKAIYPPILGFFTLYMIISGLYMMYQKKTPISSLFLPKGKWTSFRGLHRNLSSILWLPFTVTVCTGAIYRMLKTWFSLEKDSVSFLLSWHQGKFVPGLGIEYVYPILIGVLALAAMSAGVTMNKSIMGISKPTEDYMYTLPGGDKKRPSI